MNDFFQKVSKLHRVLKELSSDSWSNDLCGACAFSAYIVYKLAERMGYHAVLCLSNEFKWGSHCWCIVDDIIVDATATQFPELEKYLDEEEILVTPNKNIYKELLQENTELPSGIDETSFLSLTSNWDDQSITYCFEKYGNIIKQNFDIEFSMGRFT